MLSYPLLLRHRLRRERSGPGLLGLRLFHFQHRYRHQRQHETDRTRSPNIIRVRLWWMGLWTARVSWRRNRRRRSFRMRNGRLRRKEGPRRLHLYQHQHQHRFRPHLHNYDSGHNRHPPWWYSHQPAPDSPIRHPASVGGAPLPLPTRSPTESPPSRTDPSPSARIDN